MARAAAKKAIGIGTRPTAVEPMAAARTRSGSVALRMVPSRISRCASGRQPKSCRNDGSSRRAPCSTTISPALKRMLPSRCFSRSPCRLTASRLTLWLLNSARRCAVMPIERRAAADHSLDRRSISAPVFSPDDGERSPEIFSLACETIRSSASGPPSSSRISSASQLDVRQWRRMQAARAQHRGDDGTAVGEFDELAQRLADHGRTGGNHRLRGIVCDRRSPPAPRHAGSVRCGTSL